jgi:sugar O-acyltransferase (sialic acid O-acetyltransferase NeuD family)
VTEARTLYVFGAGGHGKVVADAALAAGLFAVEGFLDDDPTRRGTVLLGVAVRGDLDAIEGRQGRVDVALGVGSNRARLDLLERITAAGHRVVSVIHPAAFVASGVAVGSGTFVAPRAIVHTDARIGRACIVNSGAVVEHDCVLGDGVHVSPGAVLGGNVTLGAGSHVGLGSVVLPGLKVGAGAIVGAGAVVIEDVPAGATVVGVPAREARPARRGEAE